MPSRSTCATPDPAGEAHTTAQMVLVSNNPYQLADLSGIGTRERIDLGELGVVTAQIEGAPGG